MAVGMNGGGLSVGERVVADLLQAAHLTPPDRLADLLASHATRLGMRHITVYLADLQYLVLVPVTGTEVDECRVLRIDATMAGRVFRTLSILSSEEDGDHRVWVPLVDGTVRLGVLELVVASPEGGLDEALLTRCQIIAQITGLLIVSKGHYSDTFAKFRRREPMELSAELEWAFMPPQSLATDQVAVAAALEPAYRVGGDAYDLSLVGDDLYLSLFDAVGHDLTAGLVAALTMAVACNTRRSGGGPPDVAVRADQALTGQGLTERFITAVVGVLHIVSGRFEWVNCGHPPPLLIRDDRVVKELSRQPGPPIGLLNGETPVTHVEDLEPGDRLLFYSDGVVEARTPGGDLFGLRRLTDTVIRTAAAGIPASEALRRLVHGLLAEHAGRLTDDATVMLVEWRPEDPGALISHGISRDSAGG